MKKIRNLLLCFVIITAISVSLFSVPALAAASAVISFSQKTCNVGDTVTVTGKLNMGEGMYAFDGTIKYDPSVMEYVSGGDTASGGEIRKVTGELSGETVYSFSVTFRAKSAGNAGFTFTGSGGNENGQPVGGSAGATLTVNGGSQSVPETPGTPNTPATPEKSSNANLASLKVTGATLSPAFSPKTTSYVATAKYGVEKVTLSGSVADAGAAAEGFGTFDIKVGDNPREIKVTASNGTVKKYTVNIKRLTEQETAELEQNENAPDPLSVTVDGKSLRIVSDISKYQIPQGFSYSVAQVGDEQVGKFTDNYGKYELFYLADGEGKEELYYLDGDEYKPLWYITVNSKMYIMEEPDDELFAPDGYKETKFTVTMGDARAFAFEDKGLSDFYYLYLYADGETQFYRYDKLCGTIQRAPEFKLVTATPTVSEKTNEKNLWKIFMGMNVLGKTVIILAVLIAALIIALIILLIIKRTSSYKNVKAAEFRPDIDVPFEEVDGFDFGDDDD